MSFQLKTQSTVTLWSCELCLCKFLFVKSVSYEARYKYRKWPNKRLLSNKRPLYAFKIVLDAPA